MTPLNVVLNTWMVWLVTWWADAAWSSRAAKRPAIGRELVYRLLTIAGAVFLFGSWQTRRSARRSTTSTPVASRC